MNRCGAAPSARGCSAHSLLPPASLPGRHPESTLLPLEPCAPVPLTVSPRPCHRFWASIRPPSGAGYCGSCTSRFAAPSLFMSAPGAPAGLPPPRPTRSVATSCSLAAGAAQELPVQGLPAEVHGRTAGCCPGDVPPQSHAPATMFPRGFKRKSEALALTRSNHCTVAFRRCRNTKSWPEDRHVLLHVEVCRR